MVVYQQQDPEPEPLLSELESAVKQPKENKSPGLDNIPSKILKNQLQKKASDLLIIISKRMKILTKNELSENVKRIIDKIGGQDTCSSFYK